MGGAEAAIALHPTGRRHPPPCGKAGAGWTPRQPERAPAHPRSHAGGRSQSCRTTTYSTRCPCRPPAPASASRRMGRASPSPTSTARRSSTSTPPGARRRLAEGRTHRRGLQPERPLPRNGDERERASTAGASPMVRTWQCAATPLSLRASHGAGTGCGSPPRARTPRSSGHSAARPGQWARPTRWSAGARSP